MTTIGINSLVAACQIFFVLYATDVLKITGAQYAIAVAFMLLSPAVPALWAGFRMDIRGRKRFLVLGYVLYIPAMLLFVTAIFTCCWFRFSCLGLGNMLGRTAPGPAWAIWFLVNFGAKRWVACSSSCTSLRLSFTCLLVSLYSYVAPWLPFVLLAAAAVPLGSCRGVQDFRAQT